MEASKYYSPAPTPAAHLTRAAPTPRNPRPGVFPRPQCRGLIEAEVVLHITRERYRLRGLSAAAVFHVNLHISAI